MAARGIVAASGSRGRVFVSLLVGDKGGWGRTFKSGGCRDVEGCVLPGDGVLSVAARGRAHLVEGRHAVARFELEDIGADLLDDTGDVIALIEGVVEDVRELPVLGVAARDDHFNEDLVVVGRRNGGVHDLDFGP